MFKKIRAALVWLKEGLQAMADLQTGGYVGFPVSGELRAVMRSLEEHVDTAKVVYLYTDQFTAT